jgi:hypothetical protein
VKGKNRRAPTEAFLSLPFSPHTNPTPHFDAKQGQGVELALGSSFLNIPQHLKIQNYANFQPNPSQGDFLYIKADILCKKKLMVMRQMSIFDNY